MGGHDKVVERLVAAKAEVNAADKVGDEARGDTGRAQTGLGGGGLTGVRGVSDAGLAAGRHARRTLLAATGCAVCRSIVLYGNNDNFL